MPILSAEDLKHLQRIRKAYSVGVDHTYWALCITIDTLLGVDGDDHLKRLAQRYIAKVNERGDRGQA